MSVATEITAEPPKTRDLPGVLGLILILACFTVISAVLTRRLPSSGSMSTTAKAYVYGVTFVFEWIFTAYAIWRLRRLGLSVTNLVKIPSTVKGWLIDIGITLGFFLVFGIVELGLTHLLKPATPTFSALFPTTSIEIALWIALSITAGFCEELVFRGYLQHAIAASSNTAIAIIVQGVIFGLVHSYQGVKYVTIIIVLGMMVGLLVHWCRKLWPAMMFHAITDIIGVLFR